MNDLPRLLLMLMMMVLELQRFLSESQCVVYSWTTRHAAYVRRRLDKRHAMRNPFLFFFSFFFFFFFCYFYFSCEIGDSLIFLLFALVFCFVWFDFFVLFCFFF